MKGIEISKAYFNEYGLPMLNNDFLEILPIFASVWSEAARTATALTTKHRGITILSRDFVFFFPMKM